MKTTFRVRILLSLFVLAMCPGSLLQSAFAATGIDKVICVPWQGDPLKYHTAISGLTVRIKGVVKTTGTGTIWYKWVYGDGNSSVVQSASGAQAYDLESDHIYAGSVGTPFTAKLLVDGTDSSMANAVQDTYLLKIEGSSLDSRVNVAIDNGLWFLHKNKYVNANIKSFNTKPVAVWRNDYAAALAAPTASAVQAYEINGHKETGNEDEDPYVSDVKGGLNWLFNGYFQATSNPMLRGQSIAVQRTGENPDSNGNGFGVTVDDVGYPIYQGGMVMDAIISSGAPNADTGRDFDGDGKTDSYGKVLQDMCDMYAWGQYDGTSGGFILGAWRYNWGDFPDNSAAQWAAIGMIPAQQAPWNCTVPSWVKTYDNNWLNYSFQANVSGHAEWGGFGYTGQGNGVATTPSGMVQLSFIGADTTDTRWVRAERWFADNWTSWLNDGNTWTYYGYYAFVKAMRVALPNPVTTFTSNGFDWYRGGSGKDGLAKRLSDQLIANHSWPSLPYHQPRLTTAWAVIMLRPTLFQEAPIACYTAQPNPNYPDFPIDFDPNCSGHSDPAKSRANLVLYEWDWNNDGTYDLATTTPQIVQHSFPCPSVPCVFTVTLRVTDDVGSKATYQQDIQITNPPHPPVAKTAGPFWVSLCSGDSLRLDASASFDVDAGQHQAGCTTCPDDGIISWMWDVNGAPYNFEGPGGANVNVPDYRTLFPNPGIYDIGVRVTDNTALAFPGAHQPNLTDDEFTQVYVYASGICDLTATTHCQGVDVSWAAVPGATSYIVYVSAFGANYGFTQVATTTSTSSSLNGFPIGVARWIRVAAVTSNQTLLSKALQVISNTADCTPIAYAGGPYTGCVGQPVTLSATASTARLGTLVLAEWDLNNDGNYSDATGFTVQNTWNAAGTYTVGVRVTSQGNGQTLTSTATATVTISVCQCITDLLARAKLDKIQLTWKPLAGAASYDVYRSSTPWFTASAANRIATGVVTTYATYLDQGLTVGATYYYKVISRSAAGAEVCVSNEAGATAMPRTGNVAPAANAGPDQVVPISTIVKLDGSQSFDGNGQALKYKWRIVSKPAGSAAALSSTAAVNPNFKADIRGAYAIELIVNDGIVDSLPDTVRITTPNTAPVANAGIDQALTVGSVATLDGSASSDPNGDPLTYLWILSSRPAASSAQLLNPTQVQPTLPIDAPGTYQVTLVVNDGISDSAPDVMMIQTINSAPTARITYAKRTIGLGQADPFSGATSSDPDFDPLTYQWTLVSAPSGSAAAIVSPTSATPTLTPDKAGDYQVKLIVNDGHVASAPAFATITGNAPPTANAGPDIGGGHVGVSVSLSGLGSNDPENDPLTYQWNVIGAPAGSVATLQIPNSASPSFTPDKRGDYTIHLVVSDSFSNASDDMTLSVINTAPTGKLPADHEVPIGALAAVSGSASFDVDGDPLTYKWSLTGRPVASSATLNSFNGVSTTFTPDAPGTYSIQLIINDGIVDGAPVTVNLRTANRPPVANAGGDQANFLGSSFVLDGSASSDPDADPLTYSWVVMTKPAGSNPQLQNANTVAPTLIPDVVGTYELKLTVSDNRGGSSSDLIDVTAKPYVIGPSLSGLSEPEARQALQNAGLIVGQIKTQSDETVPVGIVLGQVPAAGIKLDPGSVVDLILSSGPDVQTPVVTVTSSAQFAHVGDMVVITVQVSDDGVIATESLTVNGTPVSLTGNQATFVPGAFGSYHLEAFATDAVGHTGSGEATFYVVDPSDTTPPTVVITSPADNSDVSKKTEVIGSVFDPSGQFASYVLEYAPLSTVNMSTLDSPVFKQIAGGTAEVHDGLLGSFDPTTLANDAYLIRVTAWDQNGQGRRDYIILNATGALKLGNFRLEYQDLSLPLAGMGIQVTRIYDTLDAQNKGDFGYGWSLGVRDARITETKRIIAGYNTFYPGTKVYITTPDGRRVGFTAYTRSDGGFLFPYIVEVALKPDPGVYDKLAFKGAVEGDLNAWYVSGAYVQPLGTDAFDPNDYVLTTRDGKTYEYSQSDGLQKVTDLNANRLEFTYDGIFHYASGQATPDQKIDFVRDADGRIEKIIDPDGHQLRYTYDALGNLATITDAVGNPTQFSYLNSPSHYLDTIVDPLGHQAVKTQYDADGRIIGITDAGGNTIGQGFDLNNNTVVSTDGRGNTTVTHYDDRGNVTEFADQLGHTTHYQYDASNNLISKTDPRGGVTQTSYDAHGHVSTFIDALGHQTTFTRNAQGYPTHVEDPLGRTIDFVYDAHGNLTESIDNAGTHTSMGRDSSGRITSYTDATGHVTHYEYSGASASKPSKITNPDGTFRMYQYESKGHATSAINEVGAEIKTQYDANGRVISIADPLGHQATYQYNGSLLSAVTDPLGKITHIEYDTLNRTNKVTDPAGNIVRFEYDANGNRTKVTDAAGNATQYSYDAANRMTQNTDQLGHTRTYSYDDAGNQTEMIDRNGNRRTFVYDLLNRKITENWWTGAVIGRTISYAYNEVGARTVAQDPAARYDYAYDGLNRLINVHQSNVPGQPDFTLNYTYDAAGRQLSVTDDNGDHIDSAYDTLGRVSNVKWEGPDLDAVRINYTYDAAGMPTEIDRYSDSAGSTRISYTEYNYNLAGLPNQITHRDGAGASLAQYNYTHDAANQITAWIHDGDNGIYAYDSLGQLISGQHTITPNETFVYDADGNRIGSQSGGAYTTAPGNRIVSDGAYSYTYDPEGNLATRTKTSDGELTTYAYDARNRLISAIVEDSGAVTLHTASYTYDALDRRIAKTVDGQTTRFLYDHNAVWADLDEANTFTARYLTGKRVDDLLARQRPGDGRAYYLTDHIGTIRKLVDATGAVVADLNYGSFGNPLLAVSPAADRYRFQGRELDDETGLYYFRARYYSPDLGRFISRDPLEFEAGDDNFYRFVGNAPLTRKDPYGLDAVEYAFLIGRFTGTIEVKVGEPPDMYETSGAVIGYLQGFSVANLIAVGSVLGHPDDLHAAFLEAEAQIEALANYAGTAQHFTSGFVGGYFGGISGGEINIKIGPLMYKEDLTPSVGGFENGIKDGLDWIKACGIN